MDGRAHLRRLMSDVEVAATRAERSLARARSRTYSLSKAAETDGKEIIALRSSLILACLLMAARLISGQN